MKTDVAIVGGGIAGLSLALELQKRGVHYQLFEASSEPGGLCNSWQDSQGYWHDYGPHIFHNFEGFKWFKELLPRNETVELLRNDDMKLSDGRIVSYPVQTSCVDLIEPEPSVKIMNYGDYCRHHYGSLLSSLFYFPWNEKIYNTHISNIDISVTSRVPAIAQPSGTYLYPSCGRFGALPEAMAERLLKNRKHYSSPVTYIDSKQQYLLGDIKCHYKVLVWSAPFRSLVTYLHLNPKFLRYSDLYLVTKKVGRGHLPGLARYRADGVIEHRESYEAVLKNNNDQFVQLEINADYQDRILEMELNDVHDTAFVLPDAYVTPTIGWIKELSNITCGLRKQSIILHGKAGTTIHKNIWPIVQDSMRLADEIHQMVYRRS